MSEVNSNQDGKQAVTNGNGEAKKNEAKLATLKLVENKTHLGPVSANGRSKIGLLSAAANRIRLDGNLKVKLAGDNNTTNVAVSTSNSYLVLSREPDPTAYCTSLLYMEAWDKVFKGPGTPAYVRKANALSKARAEVYEELGIIPNPKERKGPVLTEAQRKVYNERLKPFAFDYWEYKLSWKAPGKKATRSLVYRTLTKIDPSSAIKALKEGVDQAAQKYEITVRPRNESK